MKKALAILTAFLLCALLPAFGEEAALTIGDLMRANSTRAILDAHENLIMAYEPKTASTPSMRMRKSNSRCSAPGRRRIRTGIR